MDDNVRLLAFAIVSSSEFRPAGTAKLAAPATMFWIRTSFNVPSSAVPTSTVPLNEFGWLLSRISELGA